MNTSPLCSPSRTRGFTLIELLTVVAIIAMLVAGSYGAYGSIMEKMKKTEARTTCVAIATAVEQFESDYSHLPQPTSASGQSDVESDTTGPEGLVGILLGRDVEKNPRSTDYLGDIQAAEEKNGKYYKGLLNEEGNYELYDGWGHNYKVWLDLDYDGIIQNPDSSDTGRGRQQLKKKTLVYSIGRDGDQRTWEDNVASWK
jgi:prepilin-type N-terminal cleavage/methylation domain-containing protein